MAAKKKTPTGEPCETCGGVECGSSRVPVCCDSCTH
jgi:hypothetical protein